MGRKTVDFTYQDSSLIVREFGGELPSLAKTITGKLIGQFSPLSSI